MPTEQFGSPEPKEPDNSVDVIVLTEDDVRRAMEKLLVEHPYLKDFKPHDDCCRCCQADEVRERHGGRAAQAWETLNDFGWLSEEDAAP